jgi:DNA-binding CsgD family transcriptional regulator
MTDERKQKIEHSYLLPMNDAEKRLRDARAQASTLKAHNYTNAEIAEMLGISESVVRQILGED